MVVQCNAHAVRQWTARMNQRVDETWDERLRTVPVVMMLKSFVEIQATDTSCAACHENASLYTLSTTEYACSQHVICIPEGNTVVTSGGWLHGKHLGPIVARVHSKLSRANEEMGGNQVRSLYICAGHIGCCFSKIILMSDFKVETSNPIKGWSEMVVF